MNEVKQQENAVMRADEVRRLLRIGRNTLYSWCQQDMIPHKRVGRVILFSWERIREWLDDKKKDGGMQ
jgi:excisionase family DNA binding protein